ncbi:nucleotidyltransferase family protein [Formosa haliotis]|uniref:nucleotidyltransferase family protein n=1 Tax=Formosa haliotis TaxID=1555194 RepID=UPI00082409EF|nr:nucleotidyltransferase family protein [Formosa haliotis]
MKAFQNTLHHIASILSFENNREQLKLQIENKTIDWDNIVKVASSYLILPAIYSRLKSKDLLNLLPEELKNYLQYISDLNTDRNNTLLEEVKLISKWFSLEQIEHVFLKGTAMIASNYYKDNTERMIGDIDVLVPKNQSQKAFDLLLSKGYTYASTPTINPKYFEDKHLYRLASKAHIGAVEIHFKLLDKDQKDFEPRDVLADKQFVGTDNIPIASVKHLVLHNILNFQINDKGSYYNFIGLKNYFDTLVLLPRLNTSDLASITKNVYVRDNINLGTLYFKEFPSLKKTIRERLKLNTYRFISSNRRAKSLHYKSLAYFDLSKLLLHRTWFFIKNKNYRKDVLNDKERITEFIKSKL